MGLKVCLQNQNSWLISSWRSQLSNTSQPCGRSDDKVDDTIRRLKNNKAADADGLPAELFKTGGDRLTGVGKIWQLESMPTD